MPVEIRMPSLSPSMKEGALARWVKIEGDRVQAGDILAEIETDKALVDLEAAESGILSKPLFADGASGVPVDAVIGYLLLDGETPSDITSHNAADAKGSSLPETLSGNGQQPDAPMSSTPTQSTSHPGVRLFASPLARRIAVQRNIDLSLVKGSGPNGRIIKADVESFKAHAVDTVAKATVENRQSAHPAAIDTTNNFEEIPHSGMRRVIAQRLTEAKQNIPHFYLSIDCVLDPLLTLRGQVNRATDGVKISVNDFVIKAVAAALRDVPDANASWTESSVRRYRDIDVSVAVATPGGLITPVIRGADKKSVGAVSREMKELAERARAGRLLPADYQGGGFTISNLGMFGIKEFAAIINPPQACILAVGAGESRPIIKDGSIVAATVMTCTLSVDHRVVDGSVGAQFLGAFRKLIESPMALLI